MPRLGDLSYHNDAILNLEYELARLHRKFDLVLSANPGIVVPTESELIAIDVEIQRALCEKYPKDRVEPDPDGPKCWLSLRPASEPANA